MRRTAPAYQEFLRQGERGNDLVVFRGAGGEDAGDAMLLVCQ